MVGICSISPREEGSIAFFEGKGFADNPYSPLMCEHEEWLDGYASEVESVIGNFDECYGPPQGTA